jgi:hypothetical protein
VVKEEELVIETGAVEFKGTSKGACLDKDGTVSHTFEEVWSRSCI